MAVNMNKRETRQMLYPAIYVLFALFSNATSQTTIPATTASTATTVGVTTASTAIPTTTTTTPTTTTTTPTTTPAPSLPPPTELDQNSLIGQCTCDLTGNGCDVNCCCDEDCTSDDRSAFECKPITTNADNRVCFRKEIILFENSDPIISEINDEDLFCIYHDNKEERNFYTMPSLVESLSTFNDYRAEFPTFTFQSDPLTTLNFEATFYKSGDPIYTVYESQAVGELGMPTTLNSADCVDNNPTSYLLDERHTCSRSIENLNADCAGSSSAAGLDANSFITGFRVVSSPQMFQVFNTTEPGTNGFYSLYNNTYTVPVELDTTTSEDPIQCVSPSSTLVGPCNYPSLPPPSPVGGNTCKDVIRQVHYRLITDGTNGITRVLARFVLGEIPVVAGTVASFTQTFSATFEDTSSSGQTPFKRSGNIGYVVGQPVLAGTWNKTSDANAGQIFLNSNRNRYMTVVKASASGDCISDSDDRISVVFGQNVRSGCILRVSASNLTQYCALMQQKIIETMEYDSVPEYVNSAFTETHRYVGLYGNSDVLSGDWVKILYENRFPPTVPATGSSSCQLSLGMHIQILYANIGALVNPQPKIIAVSFSYDPHTAVQIRPTLVGEYNQPIEITTSVAFVDVSKPAVGYEGEPPIFLAKLPYDFFYPFISGASAPKSLLCSLLLPSLLLSLTVFRLL